MTDKARTALFSVYALRAATRGGGQGGQWGISLTCEDGCENCIERSLVEGSRYEKDNPADFDREFALDREKFWRFLETTQPKELEKLKDCPNWQRLILVAGFMHRSMCTGKARNLSSNG